MTWNDLLAKAITAVLTVVPAVIAAIVVFIITLFVAAWLARLVRNALKRRKIRRELVILGSRITRWGVIITGVIWSLQIVGFNVSAFIAGLGVTGLVIGFALQDISKNFTSGALLMVQEPFSLGDYISVAGQEGEVLDVQMRATELLAPNGLRVLIPNADVFANTIVNYTKTHRRRVSPHTLLDNRHLSPFRPNHQLLHGRRTEGIGSGQQDAPAGFLETFGQFGRRGGLTGAVDPDKQCDPGRPLSPGGQGRCRPEYGSQTTAPEAPSVWLPWQHR